MGAVAGLDEWDRMHLVYLIAVLMAVLLMTGSRFGSVGWRSAAKMALMWVAIFGTGFVLFSFRGEFRDLGMRLLSEADPARPVSQGDAIAIRRSADGHFRVRASVNGAPVPFVIDSGASGIALTRTAAAAAGINLASLDFSGVAMTASGMTRTASARLDSFSVGPISLGAMSAVVLPIDGGDSLLGMSFLNALKSWRVEGDQMLLIPHSAP